MDNGRTKVYVGRRSMCAGDDMNAPNMKNFYLPDTLDELVATLNKILPFATYECYLGYPTTNISSEEDGIMVSSQKDSHIILSRVENSDKAVGDDRYTIEYVENWQELIKANPYLYCE